MDEKIAVTERPPMSPGCVPPVICYTVSNIYYVAGPDNNQSGGHYLRALKE